MNTNNKKLNDALLSFKRKITESFLKDAKDFGFSPSHFEVLIYLSDKGPVTMKEVAKWLNITPPSVSALVDKLVAKNFIKRINSDEDRRTIQITLGEEAHKIFIKLHKKKDIVFEEMLGKLSDKDKNDLIRIINKCID